MTFIKVRSLQSKILVLFLFLLFIAQLGGFFYTYQANVKLESIQLNNRLNNAADVFNTQFNNRRYYLSAFAETVAKDYGLKSVLKEDTRTLLVALNNHRKRIDSNLALVLDVKGKVLGHLFTNKQADGTDKIQRGTNDGLVFEHSQTLLGQDKLAQLVTLNGKLYQLNFAPVKEGARTIGWIGFGYLIDAELALDLAKLTGVHIGFVNHDGDSYHVIASSDNTNYPTDGEVYKGIIANTEQKYLYRRVELGNIGDGYVSAILFESRADLLKHIDIQWASLAILLSLSLILSTLGAVAIARSITKPITKLVKQAQSITQGNYDQSVDVSNSKELQQLSEEFNHMTKAIVSREETISFHAFHDPLTHLPNRNSLINTLETLADKQQPFLLIQLCYLRADEITDTLGYQVGDEVTMTVARRLESSQLDINAFHLGAEYFVLIVKPEQAEQLIDKLLAILNVSCHFERIALHLQYAFGIVDSTQYENSSASELLKKSSVAIQRAKSAKKSFEIYNPVFDENTLERLFLTNSLKQAIEEDQLTLHYQPKLCLATMTVSHAEALVRWQHPEKGLIPPDEFISIAEKTGQMAALTRWVTKAAFDQYLTWQQQGIVINIAINISAENILDESYPDFVINLKKQYQLDDNAITLEVTEDAVVDDPKQATKMLSYLRDNGFKLSVDDYGTGYSSLAQLKQLPVQELKIDRSFVQQLENDENDKIIVKSTIELAHNMSLSVVAEGIEDEYTLNWLKEHNCQLAQGYFISRPLPSAQFTQWLETTHYQVKRVNYNK